MTNAASRDINYTKTGNRKHQIKRIISQPITLDIPISAPTYTHSRLQVHEWQHSRGVTRVHITARGVILGLASKPSTR